MIIAKIVIWALAAFTVVNFVAEGACLAHYPERKKFINFFWLFLGTVVCIFLSIVAHGSVVRFENLAFVPRMCLSIIVCLLLFYLDCAKVWKWADQLAFGVRYSKVCN